MKKFKLFLISLLVLSLIACGNNESTNKENNKADTETSINTEVAKDKWTKTSLAFGGESADRFNAVDINENKYVAVGYTKSSKVGELKSNGGQDALIAFFNENNEVEWSAMYGGQNADSFNDVAITDSNECIAVGYSYGDRGAQYASIVKYNKDGTVAWENKYENMKGSELTSVVLHENDVIVVGSTYNGTDNFEVKGAADIYVARYTLDGTLVWERNYGGTKFDKANDIVVYDNTLILVGETMSTDIENIVDLSVGKETKSDAFIIKLDTDGKFISGNIFGGDKNDYYYGVDVNDVGNIVAVGSTASKDMPELVVDNKADSVCLITSIKSDGTFNWHTSYGTTFVNVFNAIDITDDNRYFVTGYAVGIPGAKSNTAMNGILLEFNNIGGLINSYFYVGSSDNVMCGVKCYGKSIFSVGSCTAGTNGIDEHKGATDGIIIIE